MNKIRIITAVVVAVLAFSTLFVASSAFGDVYEYTEAIDLLASVGVIRGYSSTQFGPDDGVTRWQMALLISKLVTGNVDTAYWESSETTARFTDVSASRHYLRAITYASEHGIVKGRSDTSFDPDSGITLQEGATMIVRALGYPAGDYDSEYPRSYMTMAEELGLFSSLLVDGRQVSSFDSSNWKSSLTRGQTAQLLYNASFALTYSSGTIIKDVFKYSDDIVVFAASGDFRITPAVSYARPGELIFLGLMDDGTLRGQIKIPESAVSSATGSTDFDQYVGCAFRIVTTGADRSNIISFSLYSSSATYSSGLTAVEGDEHIALFDTMYKVVNAYSSPREKGKSPETNEIIVYCGVDTGTKNMQLTSGNVLSASKIASASAYYDITTFDDNHDGLADRAIFRPFSFAKYTVSPDGGIDLAGGSAMNQIKYENRAGMEPRDGDWVMYRWDSQTRTFVINKIYSYINGLRLLTFNAATDSSSAFITYDNNQRYYIGREGYIGATGAEVVSVFKNDSDIRGRLCDVILDGDRVVRIDLYDKTTSMTGTVHFANMGVVTKTVGSQSPTGLAVCLNGADEKEALPILSVNGSVNGVKKIELGSYVQYEKTEKGVDLTIMDERMTYSSATVNASLKVTPDSFTVTENGVVTFSADINEATLFIVFDDLITPRAVNYKDFRDNISGYKAIYVSKSGWNGDRANLVYVRRLKTELYGSSSGAFSSIVWIGSDDLSDKNIAVSKASDGSEYYSYTGTDIRTAHRNVNAYKMIEPGAKLTRSGYYRLINDYIVMTEPVVSHLSGNGWQLSFAGTVSNAAKFHEGSYEITINDRSYAVKAADLKVYGKSGSGLTSNTRNLTPQNIGASLIGKTCDVFFRQTDSLDGVYYYELILIM